MFRVQATGEPLGSHWGATGEPLGCHRGAIGEPLGSHWGATGEPLGSHWGAIFKNGATTFITMALSWLNHQV